MLFCAENPTGLKLSTEGVDLCFAQVVEERSVCIEVQARAWVERTEVRMLA